MSTVVTVARETTQRAVRGGEPARRNAGATCGVTSISVLAIKDG